LEFFLKIPKPAKIKDFLGFGIANNSKTSEIHRISGLWIFLLKNPKPL